MCCRGICSALILKNLLRKIGRSPDMELVVASYNIHRCYGRGGQHQPERIKSVLQQLNADIIALQEVESLHDAPNLLDFLCSGQGWQSIQGITMNHELGHYGNALLTSLPVELIERIDLSLPGREPRGALRVMLSNQGKPLEVTATHLGLWPYERRWQIRQLLDRRKIAGAKHASILMGDLNEWFLWGRPLRWLKREFSNTPAPLTFPARRPLFALDRIWVDPGCAVTAIKALNTPLTRSASDHLPLRAVLKI
jgi:endonuclease/exonuclease/phosphatase family metal-dependent hydrolase